MPTNLPTPQGGAVGTQSPHREISQSDRCVEKVRGMPSLHNNRIMGPNGQHSGAGGVPYIFGAIATTGDRRKETVKELLSWNDI
jgi:hypothetical protein